MAIEETTKFVVADCPELGAFDTKAEALLAEARHKTQRAAEEFVRMWKPYPSPKYDHRFVEAIVDYELWSAGLIGIGQVDGTTEPPDESGTNQQENCNEHE